MLDYISSCKELVFTYVQKKWMDSQFYDRNNIRSSLFYIILQNETQIIMNS